jgi:hypothetical protein
MLNSARQAAENQKYDFNTHNAKQSETVKNSE